MLRNFISKVKEIQKLRREAKLNRNLVGVDRSGNKYFQYFDDDGYESKRECEYINVFGSNHPNTMDPAWEEWLRKKRLNPYTPEEMAKIYKHTDAIRQRGMQADANEMQMMNTFRRTDSYNATDKKDFNPASWDFDQKK